MTVPMERIRNLLAMAEHATSNENEAAIALEKAQALLLQHNLDRASVDTGNGTAPEGIGKVELRQPEGYAWKVRILAAIAKANLCRVITERWDKRAHVFGNKSNVLAVVEMYQWVVEQLESIANRELGQYKRKGGIEHGRTWKAAFYDGARHTIQQRLQRPLEEFSRGTGRDLVLVNTRKVDDAVSRTYPHLRRNTHYVKRWSDGYGSGRTAGGRVSFRRARQVSSGPRALGSGAR